MTQVHPQAFQIDEATLRWEDMPGVEGWIAQKLLVQISADGVRLRVARAIGRREDYLTLQTAGQLGRLLITVSRSGASCRLLSTVWVSVQMSIDADDMALVEGWELTGVALEQWVKPT